MNSSPDPDSSDFVDIHDTAVHHPFRLTLSDFSEKKILLIQKKTPNDKLAIEEGLNRSFPYDYVAKHLDMYIYRLHLSDRFKNSVYQESCRRVAKLDVFRFSFVHYIILSELQYFYRDLIAITYSDIASVCLLNDFSYTTLRKFTHKISGLSQINGIVRRLDLGYNASPVIYLAKLIFQHFNDNQSSLYTSIYAALLLFDQDTANLKKLFVQLKNTSIISCESNAKRFLMKQYNKLDIFNEKRFSKGNLNFLREKRNIFIDKFAKLPVTSQNPKTNKDDIPGTSLDLYRSQEDSINAIIDHCRSAQASKHNNLKLLINKDETYSMDELHQSKEDQLKMLYENFNELIMTNKPRLIASPESLNYEEILMSMDKQISMARDSLQTYLDYLSGRSFSLQKDIQSLEELCKLKSELENYQQAL